MRELKTIGRHAATVLVGQLAVMAFGITDTIVAGRYSEGALAALSVGSAIYISVYVALMGVMQALLPIWAELHGARQPIAVGRSVRQALYLCAFTIVVGMAALLFPGPLLRWTGVPVALQGEVERYLAVLALALAPALLFRLYGTLNQSLGKPLLVTWLQIGSLAIKVPLSIGLAFGGSFAGVTLPAQGAVGCAWATLVVNYAMLAVAAWLLRTRPLYAPYRIWRRPEPPDWAQIRKFARLGVPGGLAIMVEVTSFTLMALFIARMGTQAAASHQIASNLAAVLYMVPLSLSIATSARVSFWLGAGDPVQARRVVRTGLTLTVGAALLLAVALVVLREPLAAVYTPGSAVAALAANLLIWVAAYHLADAVQALCVFVLRCYRVTLVPLLVYCILLWGLGLAGGYVLAYESALIGTLYLSPAAFWLSSVIALWITAALFVVILWQVARRG